MDENSSRQLLKEASLGVEAEVWWQSEVGRRIVDDIYEVIVTNVELLKTAELKDVVEIQNKIKLYEYLPRKINDLIGQGNEAIQILDGEEN